MSRILLHYDIFSNKALDLSSQILDTSPKTLILKEPYVYFSKSLTLVSILFSESKSNDLTPYSTSSSTLKSSESSTKTDQTEPMDFSRFEFYWHFISCFFVLKLCTAFLHLQFGFVIFFCNRILAQKRLINCWWNWLQVSILPTFYK